MWGNRPHERQEREVYQKPPRSVNPGAAEVVHFIFLRAATGRRQLGRMSGYGAEVVGANTRAAIPALREINLRARSVKFRRIENTSMRNTHGSTSTSPNRLRPSAVAATYLVNLD